MHLLHLGEHNSKTKALSIVTLYLFFLEKLLNYNNGDVGVEAPTPSIIIIIITLTVVSVYHAWHPRIWYACTKWQVCVREKHLWREGWEPVADPAVRPLRVPSAPPPGGGSGWIINVKICSKNGLSAFRIPEKKSGRETSPRPSTLLTGRPAPPSPIPGSAPAVGTIDH